MRHPYYLNEYLSSQKLSYLGMLHLYERPDSRIFGVIWSSD